MDMNVLCECGGVTCRQAITLSYEENLKAHNNGSLVIIDGCANGPELTDILIEKKDGYSIYRES